MGAPAAQIQFGGKSRHDVNGVLPVTKASCKADIILRGDFSNGKTGHSHTSEHLEVYYGSSTTPVSYRTRQRYLENSCQRSEPWQIEGWICFASQIPYPKRGQLFSKRNAQRTVVASGVRAHRLLNSF